jgi:predicted lipid-binding transport protein (Tim44 family)
MRGFVDIYTIIFLVLAIVIFLRLRSVLGRRTGQERPPFDPYLRREDDAKPVSDPASDKVVTLPPRQPVEVRDTAPDEAGATAQIKTLAPEGSPLAGALQAVLAADPGFDPKSFIAGARQAYEMIVTAFAEGDRKTLRQLLSRDVYDGFVAAVAEREKRQEKVEFNFVGIEKAEITDASMKNGFVQVTVRFVSQLISATRDADGAVIDGDPTHVTDVTDIWTFGRTVPSRDPNWKLVATESVD